MREGRRKGRKEGGREGKGSGGGRGVGKGLETSDNDGGRNQGVMIVGEARSKKSQVVTQRTARITVHRGVERGRSHGGD